MIMYLRCETFSVCQDELFFVYERWLYWEMIPTSLTKHLHASRIPINTPLTPLTRITPPEQRRYDKTPPQSHPV